MGKKQEKNIMNERPRTLQVTTENVTGNEIRNVNKEIF